MASTVCIPLRTAMQIAEPKNWVYYAHKIFSPGELISATAYNNLEILQLFLALPSYHSSGEH